MNLAEDVQLISFGLLGVLMIAAALGVVLLDQIVYSAFLLGGVFLCMSGLYVLLNADFVAAAQILVYVGAVNVLILFAIMLVNKQETFKPVGNRWLRQGATALVCVGLFALLSTMVLATPWVVDTTVVLTSTVVQIGKHFFSDYLLPFELASVLLLMAMVGAIILARRDFIPEKMATDTQDALTLPERPRELTGTVSDR
ncbi:NADH-quinone oxidoreductase subunit J [Spirulina major CS-329]|uniref:NADH-quinone oxidoreductase subunit J n=1 Tax=Spirulina TaxID=1154 RepID=UPI00232FE83D|nr:MULTISPECIES: NADH-quinone oxidoreductase subunit J [Spirulina]MDB9493728.1 NADH-quinone oxidoreductase subunit J [Spirulina subsalsa CS-330]MDB9505443.1 NADH-quinone oxidoreductase subunit J [Spirulina major CS-329]